MNKHVVSQELAIKMKAAGFPKDSTFLWMPSWGKDVNRYSILMRDINTDYADCYTAAPTASEILKELPKSILHEGDAHDLIILFEPIRVEYNSDDWGVAIDSTGETLEEALGEMYCYLKGR